MGIIWLSANERSLDLVTKSLTVSAHRRMSRNGNRNVAIDDPGSAGARA